ncbi:alpha/beta hydrolase family protein [Paraburkholderia phosphatilytica]|uniref:alpha/beta hydrolase family protein n=1 Tax=Paraburkholderia phosphatilytica TaxID=2282883 RepID=UPI000F5EBF2B|nr:CocE/NonD family hydrolase [Paraburkholderia phosphatilytica]
MNPLRKLTIALTALTLAMCASAHAEARPVSLQGVPGGAPEAPLNEQILMVPVQASPRIRLQVTIYMPFRGGPFPLALINHGASHDPQNAPRVGDEFIPYYFLSRGYAVAMPMLRGYAGSEGHLKPHGCDVIAMGQDASKDIRKALDYVKELPGIDSSRIVVAGKSMGGWNTLVFGSQNPPDVKGLLNFAGGVKESDCHTPDESLMTSAGQLGATTRLRSIWFYGDNDQIFSTATWHAMFQRYSSAGGKAELVDYGAFQKDAHAMTASGAGLPLWVARADAFLASIGMPASEVDPEYLPGNVPRATSYADVNDLGAVPYLSDKQKNEIYRKFLAQPLPRAIAIGSTNGTWISGGFDPAIMALHQCWKISQYCQLYAIDNTVVWPRQPFAPPRTDFAAISNVNAIPYLLPAGRQAYARFLTMRRPRAFAIAPDGAWGAATGLDPMMDALVACGNGHTGCRIYAVDDDIVWTSR